MLSLPERQDTVRVEVDEESGVAFTMATLTDDQVAAVMSDPRVVGILAGEDQDLTDLPYGQLFELFRSQVRGAEAITVGGDPFDPDNPRHVSSIPKPLQIGAVAGLIVEELTIPEDARGNSPGPHAASPEDTAPPGSDPANAA